MSATNSENELLAAVEQLTNLVAVAITRGMKQPEAIELLGRASLSNEQIAEVLDTMTSTVRATRSRIERAAKPAAKKGSGDVTPAE